jgi:hypothetical protein
MDRMRGREVYICSSNVVKLLMVKICLAAEESAFPNLPFVIVEED